VTFTHFLLCACARSAAVAPLTRGQPNEEIINDALCATRAQAAGISGFFLLRIPQIEAMNTGVAPIAEIAATVINHALSSHRNGKEGWSHPLILHIRSRQPHVFAQIACGVVAGVICPSVDREGSAIVERARPLAFSYLRLAL
jgi:hypothetical protein